MLHGGIHQFQLLLRGAGQLLDIFQRLLGLELRQLLPKLLLPCLDFGKIRNTSMAALLSRAFSASIYACVPAAM